MSGDYMIGPGDHENAASEAIMHQEIPQATVYAILALASAVNRLAAAHEALADSSQ